MKIGGSALPTAGGASLPASVRSVLVDIVQHPGSSIGEITARTGFPQSHVSASIAKLIESGDVVTDVDPADRRRTRATVNPGAAGALLVVTDTPVDDAVAEALPDPAALPEVLAALETLARHLNPGGRHR
ncbi:hypothetical protein GCM10007977_083150 [Dactylosporangium sucinum]|uniref:HTH marR-type domain-containing protein n=2 Tax=Dactylosporangium sucinum TaxID=1424081 RepID=A0A917X571_9ACTN|nr:hypothetical protein GCM10007977_083150 [Dactylosporangium sucinum]